ncbi:MAG: 3-hydroxyacyl-CoA dehydrogenase NAD-binding domain-containing protein [Geminicoccaceae bacterium]
MSISTIAIIGAGTMGTGIATASAAHGMAVILLDETEAATKRAIETAATFYDRSVEKGRMGESDATAAKERLTSAADLADVAPADVVIEAVFEDFSLKASLFEKLNDVVRDDTLVATNTSCLRVSDLAGHLTDPSRFLGLHYFSPAQINPLVEVVKGERTSEATIATALAFCRATGKDPLTCEDQYGFAINRFFCPYTNEAAHALDQELGNTADIDLIAKEALGVAAGPFQVMNLIKPRINLHAIRNLEPLGAFYAPARSMVATGEANESWEIGEPSGPEAAAQKAIADRLRAGVFLPVLQSLDEAVAAPADIDRGARAALKFGRPPCALMDELGRDEVLRIIEPACKSFMIKVPAAIDRVGELVD